MCGLKAMMKRKLGKSHQSSNSSRSNVASASIVIFSLCLIGGLFNLSAIVRDDRALTQAGLIATTTTKKKNAVTPVPMATAHSTVVDILSIGSLQKINYQDTQQRTFGTHPAIRNFFRVNELNDTDASCYTDFSDAQLAEVLQFCNQTEGQSFESRILRERLFWPKKHTGWLCAQKRPIDGIRLVLDRYKTQPVPNYLFVIDDDSFMNVEDIIETLEEFYPSNVSHTVAGCRYTYPRKIHFSFAYGGFGSYLTKAAIEKLMRPIYCATATTPKDEFTKLACWRLEQNHIGEAQYFRDGMSIADLMYAYSVRLPFTKVREWNGTGYCLHSDHALGYFFNFYHLGVPAGTLKDGEAPNDNIRIHHHTYEFLQGDKECKNEKQSCTGESRLCHYVTPDRMELFYNKQQAAAREKVRTSWGIASN
jgi:hypothetical protein